MKIHTIHQDLISKFRQGDNVLHNTINVDESKGKYHVVARHVASSVGAISSILVLAGGALGKLAKIYNFRNGLTALCTISNFKLLTNASIVSNAATTLIDTTLVHNNRPLVRSALAKEVGLAVGSFAHLARPMAVRLIGATPIGNFAVTALGVTSLTCRVISLVRPLLRTPPFTDIDNAILGKVDKATGVLKSKAKGAKDVADRKIHEAADKADRRTQVAN